LFLLTALASGILAAPPVAYAQPAPARTPPRSPAPTEPIVPDSQF
jgi:hypothetical protein